MVKKLVYLGTSLLALIATLLGFSGLSAKGLNAAGDVAAETVNAGLKASKATPVSFFGFIGNFTNKQDYDNKFINLIASFLLFIAIICAAIILFSVIISFIKKDNEIFDTMLIKWVSVTAFGTCLLCLLISFIFPYFPPSAMPNLYEYTGTIEIGAILFLAATAIASVFSFVYKKD